MRKTYGSLLAAIFALTFPSPVTAQQSLRWQPTLEAAKALAAQSNRLILIHFWAEWCGSCRQMEQEVLSRPEVVAAIDANYVPVKVNSDYFPTTRQQYGVTALPADVVITSQGQLVERLQGLPTAAQYAARLNQLAAAFPARGQEDPARLTRGGAPARPGANGSDSNAAGFAGPGREYWQQGAPPYTRQFEGPSPAGAPPLGWPPVDQLPTHQPPLGQPPSGQATSRQVAPAQPQSRPTLGLDGYCPVQLCDDMMSGKLRWVLGNRLWGATHRGRTYLFAGPEQQRRFLAEPDRYAPVYSGNDVITAIEQGETVPGYREHGVFFGNQIYLFANEANLEKFRHNPDHYANVVLQAMRSSGDPRQGLR